MNYYLGIDIGTSGCKAVIFDEDGHQQSLSYREYDIISKKPGWAELDTDEVIKKCFDVIRESASGIKAGSVRGLAYQARGRHLPWLIRMAKHYAMPLSHQISGQMN